jgi:flagellar assembly protein FliH
MAVRLIKQGSPEASKIQPLPIGEQSDGPALREWDAQAKSADEGAILHMPASPAPKQGIQIDTAAQVDLAQVEKTAFENGFHQGEKAGMEMAEKKAEAIMRRYGDSLRELGRYKASLYSQVEREVVKLAVEVAKKIVHREIQADPEIIQTLVKVALGRVSERSSVTVRVNPIDCNFLLEKHPGWVQEEGGGHEVTLAADKSVERGGCLVQTDCGDVDARIEEEFREVERTFFEGQRQVG